MAPSRRKGISKAAVAAPAARRQWKVGDLVLAKVKGFPAWPATVSEPEKWGYTTDWKKVLVYFFGTKQIAFCNPADVEAFTEEKKETLLTKRQGKGADFVRAVQEIVDSYDKLKKANQIGESNCSLTNAESSAGVEADAAVDCEKDTSEQTLNVQIKPLYPTEECKSRSHPIEESGTAKRIDASSEMEALTAQPTDNSSASMTNHILRNGFRVRQPPTDALLRRLQPTRSSRSSLRADVSRLQTSTLPFNGLGKGARDGTQDGSLKRYKRLRKSPKAYASPDLGILASASNDSIEDDGSEIATVDSDAISLNEGSSVESGCKVQHSENATGYPEDDVEPSRRLDLRTKTVITKKKRKSNRKRSSNDVVDITLRADKDTVLEAEGNDNGQFSPKACDNSKECNFKEDGDEHLPLVKRARVRMGKISATDRLDGLSKMEEKSSQEVPLQLSEQAHLFLNGDDKVNADGKSMVLKEASENSLLSSSSDQLSEERHKPWKLQKNQSFGCSVDGEAALPPSKRLNRALEAMSANAVEDVQAPTEAPTLPNGICTSKNVESPVINASWPDNCGLLNSLSLIPKEKEKSEVVTIHGQIPEPSSPNHGGGHTGLSSIDRIMQFSPSIDDTKIKNIIVKADKAICKLDDSCCAARSPDPLPGKDDISSISTSNTAKIVIGNVEGNCCQNTEILTPPVNEDCQVEDMCETVKELKDQLENDLHTPSLPASENGPISAAQETEQIYQCASVLKDMPGIPLSPSPPGGQNSSARASPPRSSLCHISTSDNSNSPQNNGFCSPDLHLRHEKSAALDVDEGKSESAEAHRSKSPGKWTNATKAARVAFESAIGTLTRTKESIGRATRIAMDCAKFGIAAEVVDILASNMERESSMHKRVDLFFLVDSITQCSRGLKGNINGLFSSAIQAKLPRLVSAAAPPGHAGQENRRQCLKASEILFFSVVCASVAFYSSYPTHPRVLRLWFERKLFPEPLIKQHIRDLDSLNSASSTGAFSRRPTRTERAFDDPIREMEGMLVDEYGSNSSFQLPGFCMPRMLKDEDEGTDSDGESFEAVTPEHPPEAQQSAPSPCIEKHRHILADVDGELEMEDVAPSSDLDMMQVDQTTHVTGAPVLPHQVEQHFLPPFAPPLPHEVPPSSPPLPTSPPPPPPPPLPPLPPRPSAPNSFTSSVDSSKQLYMSSHVVHDSSQQSTSQHSVAPRINPIVSDTSNYYHVHECRDGRMEIQAPTSGSFASFPASHPSIPPMENNHTEAAILQHNGFHLRPPHTAQSNQFSYVQADQGIQSHGDFTPPSYHNTYSFEPNMDAGNYHHDWERMRLAPYEHRDDWRYSRRPPFHGPMHRERAKGYAPVQYGCPPCEPPRISNRGWHYPPQGINNRNSMPRRPPPEGSIHLTNRGHFRAELETAFFCCFTGILVFATPCWVDMLYISISVRVSSIGSVGKVEVE
ncbi:CID domain [Dillenia turbinata]|uniref:CID domain n=1 Tax=Dillenia turbinata TaxID=194707 RepID=A0AAN8ZKI9_9MAGN